jgi:hypothetical protein
LARGVQELREFRSCRMSNRERPFGVKPSRVTDAMMDGTFLIHLLPWREASAVFLVTREESEYEDEGP